MAMSLARSKKKNARFIKLFHSSRNPETLVKIGPVVSESTCIINQPLKKKEIEKNHRQLDIEPAGPASMPGGLNEIS